MTNNNFLLIKLQLIREGKGLRRKKRKEKKREEWGAGYLLFLNFGSYQIETADIALFFVFNSCAANSILLQDSPPVSDVVLPHYYNSCQFCNARTKHSMSHPPYIIRSYLIYSITHLGNWDLTIVYQDL